MKFSDEEKLLDLMFDLHDMKHDGTLPEKLNKHLTFIEFFDPKKWKYIEVKK